MMVLYVRIIQALYYVHISRVASIYFDDIGSLRKESELFLGAS
jgi:hypothetical protein